jgi:hypothetical protein
MPSRDFANFGKMGFDDNSHYDAKVRIAAYLLAKHSERKEIERVNATRRRGRRAKVF